MMQKETSGERRHAAKTEESWKFTGKAAKGCKSCYAVNVEESWKVDGAF